MCLFFFFIAGAAVEKTKPDLGEIIIFSMRRKHLLQIIPKSKHKKPLISYDLWLGFGWTINKSSKAVFKYNFLEKRNKLIWFMYF